MNPTVTRNSIIAFGAAVVLVAALIVFLNKPEEPCTARDVNAAGRGELVLLTDGASAAATQAAEAVQADPGAIFTSGALGFRASAEGAPAVGVVSVVRYDDHGAVTPMARFDLAGVAQNPDNKADDAAEQARCLVAAVGALAPAGHGDLLRGLDALPALVVGRPVSVIAVGLGRSTIEGEAIGGSDLSPDGLAKTFGLLESNRLVPDAAGLDAVWFVAPGEGAESGRTAGGLDSFAAGICARIHGARCGTAAGVPR